MDVLVLVGEPCLACYKLLRKQQRVYCGSGGRMEVVCCKEAVGSTTKTSVTDRLTPGSKWWTHATTDTFDRVYNAAIIKHAEKGLGL